MSKAKLKRTSESEDSSAGAAAATRFRLRGSWAAMWVLAFALQACTTAMASNCQCLQQDLQCPDALLSNFEKTNNIREAGNRAHWALECSDSLCSETCKAALEKIYGKNGYCACVNANAYDQFSMQSLTLLAMSPNQILQACFGDQCSYTFP